MWHELWQQAAPLAAGTTEEDLPALEWYPAAGEGQKAAVIVCPGGGYGRRAPHEGAPIAEWLNTLGISAAVLRYRVAPYRQPAPQLDALRAVRYVRHRAAAWGVDPERIGILGFSAGGHLASSVSYLADDGDPAAADPVERMSSRVQASILCYPVISMSSEFTHTGSRDNLLGDSPEAGVGERYSGEKMVHERTPPTFMWHTADDAVVPVENVLELATALRRHGIPHELHVFESGRHGLGLAEDHEEARAWTLLCAAWLHKRGFC
ncbi:esterase [Gordoniibacillus kamchatkensis]|uniref:Esterase n=1 Tax=Gordoniibacillus kamchatkensis TaxID=1590651 RepID=A0ABR5AFM1_9BACL|nr:alpha/beta hydrolase [Paenibacillus sp. VKM B-2647]KIL39177.1 esterase [Paenibacillus sp. VKM B-2647]